MTLSPWCDTSLLNLFYVVYRKSDLYSKFRTSKKTSKKVEKNPLWLLFGCQASFLSRSEDDFALKLTEQSAGRLLC